MDNGQGSVKRYRDEIILLFNTNWIYKIVQNKRIYFYSAYSNNTYIAFATEVLLKGESISLTKLHGNRIQSLRTTHSLLVIETKKEKTLPTQKHRPFTIKISEVRIINVLDIIDHFSSRFHFWT